MRPNKFRIVYAVAMLATLFMFGSAAAQPAAMTADMAAMAAAPAPAMAAPVPAMAAEPMAAPAVTTPAMAAPMAVAPMAVAPMAVAPMAVAPMAVAPAPAPAAEVPDETAPVESLPADAAVAADATVTIQGMSATSEPSKPATATTASAKTDPWWKSLLGGLLGILLVFVSALATGIGALLIKWIAKKMKVTDAESIAAADKLYDSAVELGVNFAEQQARKLGDNPDAKGQRLMWATEKIKEAIKDMGLAEKATDWIATRIEAKLGVKNAGKPASTPTEPPKAADTTK